MEAELGKDCLRHSAEPVDNKDSAGDHKRQNWPCRTSMTSVDFCTLGSLFRLNSITVGEY